MEDNGPLDDLDDNTYRPDSHEDEVEEARDEGFEEGVQEGRTRSFGLGCLVGFVLAFALIYMGWCSPYPLGQH